MGDAKGRIVTDALKQPTHVAMSWLYLFYKEDIPTLSLKVISIPASFKSCTNGRKRSPIMSCSNGKIPTLSNITSKCGNRFLNEFIGTLLDKTDIYLILFDSYFDEGPFSAKSPEEHTLIMEALKIGSMTEVDSLLHEHFEQAIVSLSSKIKEFKNVEDLF